MSLALGDVHGIRTREMIALGLRWISHRTLLSFFRRKRWLFHRLEGSR